MSENYEGNYGRIVVAGFSQGSSMSLNIGVKCHQTIGGVIVLCGFVFPTIFEYVNEHCGDAELISKKANLPILAY